MFYAFYPIVDCSFPFHHVPSSFVNEDTSHKKGLTTSLAPNLSGYM